MGDCRTRGVRVFDAAFFAALLARLPLLEEVGPASMLMSLGEAAEVGS
jgi:hypothetical protein